MSRLDDALDKATSASIVGKDGLTPIYQEGVIHKDIAKKEIKAMMLDLVGNDEFDGQVPDSPKLGDTMASARTLLQMELRKKIEEL